MLSLSIVFSTQVDDLKQKCEGQHEQLQKSDKKAKSVASMAAEESTKRNAAVEFVKFLDNEVLLRFPFIFISLCFVSLILWIYIICSNLKDSVSIHGITFFFSNWM